MTWEQSDAAKLREYLQKTKNRLRAYMASRIPRVEGKTLEEVALQAKYKEGFEAAIREIDDAANFESEEKDPSSGNFTTM